MLQPWASVDTARGRRCLKQLETIDPKSLRLAAKSHLAAVYFSHSAFASLFGNFGKATVRPSRLEHGDQATSPRSRLCRLHAGRHDLRRHDRASRFSWFAPTRACRGPVVNAWSCVSRYALPDPRCSSTVLTARRSRTRTRRAARTTVRTRGGGSHLRGALCTRRADFSEPWTARAPTSTSSVASKAGLAGSGSNSYPRTSRP